MVTAGVNVTLTVGNAGTTFIITAITGMDPELNFETNALGTSDVGLYWFVKNGYSENININEGGEVVDGILNWVGYSRSIVDGMSTVYINSATQIIYWDGEKLTMY
jgi:hypothetical protein